jgi:hypothetical protein
MVTKIVCIAGAAVVLVALMFLADRILPRKGGEEDGGKE